MDLSNYLAEATCAHIHEKVGSSATFKSTFQDGAFTTDPRRPNTVKLWGEYRVSFEDHGQMIRVSLEGPDRKSTLQTSRKITLPAKAPSNYREIVSRLEGH